MAVLRSAWRHELAPPGLLGNLTYRGAAGMATDLIGWLSSLILVATIAQQVHKQWKSNTSEGVSRWLFLGQLSASIGFTIYSLMVRNWVFVVTNALMIANALAGYWIVMRHRRRARQKPGNGATRGVPVHRPAQHDAPRATN
jgi:MtN3 and saliva related transmembrane protein